MRRLNQELPATVTEVLEDHSDHGFAAALERLFKDAGP